MDKQTEIQILRETIEKLGPDSYCGPWLAEQLDGIERDLRSDVYPTATIARSKDEAESIIACARKRADEIMEGVLSRSRKAEQVRDGIIVEMRACLRSLEQ
jgi:hypothetical protein